MLRIRTFLVTCWSNMYGTAAPTSKTSIAMRVRPWWRPAAVLHPQLAVWSWYTVTYCYMEGQRVINSYVLSWTRCSPPPLSLKPVANRAAVLASLGRIDVEVHAGHLLLDDLQPFLL